jgi:hypothetical protein
MNQQFGRNKERKISRLERFSTGESQSIDQIFSLGQGDDT